MDIIKNKSVIAAVVVVVVIIVVTFVVNKCKKSTQVQVGGYHNSNQQIQGDSINNLLNPHIKETEKDFDYLYDKKTGLLMSGSEFQKDDLEGKYVPIDDNPDEIPINVIAPDSFLLDDGNNGRTGLHTNMCSKMCCSAQYPLPFKLKHDKRLCNLKNFVPSNIFCNNAYNSSGCLCLQRDGQATNLYNRGGNA